MKNLLELVNNEPRVSHRTISEHTNNKQDNIIQTITKNLSDFEEFGKVQIETQKIQTAGGMQKQKTFWLNEQQYSLLMTYLRNNPKVKEFKKNMIKAFFQMKNIIEENINLDSLHGRIGGLVTANNKYRERIIFLEDMLQKIESPKSYDDGFLNENMSLNQQIDFLIQQTEQELNRNSSNKSFFENRATYWCNYAKVMRLGGNELQRFCTEMIEESQRKRNEAYHKYVDIEEKHNSMLKKMSDCCDKLTA